jgi:hypothetical protein
MKPRLTASVAAACAMLLLVAAMPAIAQDVTIDVHQHAYQRGFRDGYSYGQQARMNNQPLDYQTDQYRAGDRGYWAELGPVETYRSAYQEGFRDGAQDGFSGERTRLEKLYVYSNVDPDRGGEVGIAPEYRNRGWRMDDVASDIGFRDGVNAGLKDFNEHHPYKPTDHGAYKDANRGYSKALGDKDAYRSAYRSAYENGYRSGFGSGMGIPQPR